MSPTTPHMRRAASAPAPLSPSKQLESPASKLGRRKFIGAVHFLHHH